MDDSPSSHSKSIDQEIVIVWRSVIFKLLRKAGGNLYHLQTFTVKGRINVCLRDNYWGEAIPMLLMWYNFDTQIVFEYKDLDVRFVMLNLLCNAT